MRFRYGVKGMNCAACVTHVTNAAKKVLSEKDSVNVSLLTNSICVITERDAEEGLIRERLANALKSAGYTLVCEKEENGKGASEFKKSIVNLIVSSFFTLLVMYLSMGGMIGLPIPFFLEGHENGIWMALSQLGFTFVVIILNFRFFKNGFSALLHLSPNMDSLIATGAGAGVLYSCISIFLYFVNGVSVNPHSLYFESAAMILVLVSFGKLLEGRAKERASDAILALSRMFPKYACVLRDGEEIFQPIENVSVGDIVLIRAGEMIPIDGEIIKGDGSADESALTGESIPVDKGVGDHVCAACVLTSGYITVRATAVGEDTSLSGIIRLLEDAASSKAPIARVADRVSAVFVPVVMAISLITFTVWMMVTQNAEAALRSAIAVLVISCPCALGLATPTAITVGIGRGARNGILFRSAESLERLCDAETVVFDKTGTLTKGSPVVTDLFAYGEDPHKVLEYAAAVEAGSYHPLAFAIVEGAKKMGIEKIPQTENFFYTVGVGAKGTVMGKDCTVEKPHFSRKEALMSEEREEGTLENGIFVCKKDRCDSMERDLAHLEGEGKTTVVVTLDSNAVGIIGIYDEIREESRTAVEALKSAGVRCLMMTGDNERTAASVAKKTLMDGFYATLLPEDKERMIKELSLTGTCAMVGDGINDAPALTRADIGIAVGTGTEVAIDCADVVISDFSPQKVAEAYFLSRATLRIIKENLFWALFYNAICIPIAAGVFTPMLGWQLSPMLASAAMSVSSLFVVSNALRLRKVRIEGKKKKGEEKMKEITVKVEGMMCQRCVAHVKKALEDVRGVESAEVDLESGSATVHCSSLVSEKKIASAIVAAGYEVK